MFLEKANQKKKKKDLESTREFILYKDTKLWEQKASFPINGLLHLELKWRGVRVWNRQSCGI